ncbi:hypothetical protein POJ06DRAFT_200531 [Lipomyces tetrasporus]|uniref:Uncharacterized protein n=1 Tax=Lipomyces tetrasporus TaxID=54092 RepID=A0AAD7QMY2_9ASCO|nr:uncharacterized protein POJ06DRAFT_200531 [Lipomyces tetrasporus]KAJ8098161.1 hypothetical protein POJ06DRAFT_200531 [Lipomyces tetrasporus]
MALIRMLLYSGSAIGLVSFCIYRYTSPVSQDRPRPPSQRLRNHIDSFNPSQYPVDGTYLSMRLAKSTTTSSDARTVMLAIFNSWVMSPERNVVKLFSSAYEPVTAKVGESSLGLFETVHADDNEVILHWKVHNKLEGLHIIRAIDHGHDEVAYQLDSVFWNPWNPVGKVPPAGPFSTFAHTVYAKMMLRAGVASLLT